MKVQPVMDDDDRDDSDDWRPQNPHWWEFALLLLIVGTLVVVLGYTIVSGAEGS